MLYLIFLGILSWALKLGLRLIPDVNKVGVIFNQLYCGAVGM